jgi:MFS family permease
MAKQKEVKLTHINLTSVHTFDNWITQLDLACAPQYVFGIMGSLTFVGGVIGSFFISPIADKYGRKFTLTVVLFLLILLMIVTYFVQSLAAIFVVMILFGVLNYPKAALIYIIGSENLPKG